jgi:signal transduction histidine kinase/ActR/RegA family two-component response regulator
VALGQERLILNERIAEAAAVVGSAFTGIQSSLLLLGGIARTDKGHSQLFAGAARSVTTTSSQAWLVVTRKDTGMRVTAAAGHAPAVGQAISGDLGRLAHRALTTKGLVSGLVRDGATLRLVFALGQAAGPGTVVAQETAISPTTPISSSPTSPWRNLTLALYLSDHPGPSTLVVTTTKDAPLTGLHYHFRVGADSWLIVADSPHPLIGVLAQDMPWIILAIGVFATLLMTMIVETLGRRREYASALVEERTASLQSALAGLETAHVEVMAARDAATKATQAKNSFLSSTSHELRTPLNAVLGFTQLLQLSELSAEDSDGVERILSAGRHLLALINELIDIARIESGDLSLSLEPVLIRPIVEETSQLMAPLAAERSIQIIAACEHPALAVQADRQRVSQVLVNLISNAIKYNHRGGTVTMTCREDSTSHASITVSDTGPGISPENIERIFVPFERLGAEQTTTEGTGIGLPLARSLTEAMGGQLTASSIPGQGSAFTLSLPRAPDLVSVPVPGLAPPSRAPRLHAPPGASLSILYIEDNPANIEVVTRFLHARPNTRLRAETSGRAGIQAAFRDQPDLILLDLHLPDLHGSQVLSELKAEPATAAIPVVVLSADASHGVVRRLLADGALAYLTKPIEFTELAELLSTFATTQADDQQPQPATRIVPA